MIVTSRSIGHFVYMYKIYKVLWRKRDMERNEVQEKSKFGDFDKNLQNITDNKQYRKRKPNFIVMLLTSLFNLLKKLQKKVKLLLI